MANYKRKSQKWKVVTDSEGYEESYIPASFDSNKHMKRKERRIVDKFKSQIEELDNE